MSTGLYRVTDSLGRYAEVPITVHLGTSGPSKFPTLATTGITAGVTLTPEFTSRALGAGAVLSNVHLHGTARVTGPGAVIRNCVIDSTSTKYPVEVVNGASVLIEDCEIDGNGKASVAILGGDYTLRRCEIRNVKDGPRVEGDNVTIEDCLIHLLTRVEGGHHDTIQMRSGKNTVIRRNTLQPYRADTDDPMNAAIQFGSWTGAVPTNVLVEGNWMDGGNQTINGGFPGLTVHGNTFGPNYKFGFIGSLNGATWVGNVREDGSPAEPVPFAAPLAVYSLNISSQSAQLS